MPRIRTLQARIAALFLLLTLVVQLGGFMLVNAVGTATARNDIGQDLVAGSRVFDRLLEQRGQRLVQRAGLLSADPSFRKAIASNQQRTIDATLANYARRIGAEMTIVVGLDQRVMADTLSRAGGRKFPFPALIARARDEQRAASMALLNGQLYQLAVVPVLAPLPIAWVVVGEAADDALARELRHLTRLHVSFLTREGNHPWLVQGSTLEPKDAMRLVDDLANERLDTRDENGNASFGEEALTRVLPLDMAMSDTAVALLQQPLGPALEPFGRLQRQLAWASLIAVAISICASALIARGIARPVRRLAAAARSIAAGDYSTPPPPSGDEELRDLAVAFRTMQDAIASREARITDLAYRDELTGLPNRTLYGDRLRRALAEAAPSRRPVAVLLMDIDHFKYVNDTLGHPIGDELLRGVAKRVGRVVADATVARLGGDEFAVLLPDAGVDEARTVAADVLHALATPFMPAGHVVDVRASIGVAVFPDHGDDAVELLRRADVAMYAAKRTNVGVIVWNNEYDVHSRNLLSLMNDLRKAIDADELSLAYQPQVALGSGGDPRVETLVRWNHPVRGMVPPSEFIPLAEQTGYIRAITRWVLARAVAQCATWRAEGLALAVAINLSARDVMDSDLVERFADLLAQHACDASWISLEITESAILDDPRRAVENLERLHALGCRLAIDDYGTGYSSLAYLRRLPLQELKIDRSFVAGVATDPTDEMIVRSTIDLAHNMGLEVVAEGVEDEATLERLRMLGCDVVQGHLLARPMDATEIGARLRSGTWPRAGRDVASLRRVV